MRRASPSLPWLASLAAGMLVVLVAGAARAQDAPPPDGGTTEPAPATAVPPPPPAPTSPPPRAPAPPPRPAYAYPYYAPWGWYPPPGYYPPPPPPPPAARAPAEVVSVAAPPPGSARVPAEDPQADRAVIMPTAYTHPKGTFYVSDYEVAILQLGYALTDDTQISVTGVPPLGEERVVFLDVTLKTTLYRGGLVRVAALGSTTGLGAKEIGVVGVGRVGGVAQLCLERACRSSLSLSSDLTLAYVLIMVNGASGIFHVSRSLSLLAELDTLVPLGKDAGEINGGLASGGLRVHGTNWGLDMTLAHVLGHGGTTFPLVTLSYRSIP